MDEIIKRLEKEGRRFGIILNPPASQGELSGFREVLGFDLPPDIAYFYQQCNGFESDDYMFRIIPLREVMESKTDVNRDRFSFAEYLIYSDTWDVRFNDNDFNTYKIINHNHGTEAATELCDSLHSFLGKYLSGTGVFGEQGLYRWADEIKSR